MASPNQPRQATLVFLSSAVASLGFVAAGCGSGPATPGVARVGTTTNQSSQSNSSSSGGSKAQVAARFSACMRSHGVRNFPDPSSGGGVTITSQSGIDPQSKRFQDAERACRKLLPAGNVSPAEQAQAQAQALKFSACMRAHGVRNFPDPKFEAGGRSSLKIDSKSGIDPRSPVFQAAQKACQKLLPGKVSGGAQGPGTTQSSGPTQGKGPRGGLTLVP